MNRVVRAFAPVVAGIGCIGVALAAAVGVTAASASTTHAVPSGCTEVVFTSPPGPPGTGTHSINFHYYCGPGVPNEVITCPPQKWAGPGSTVYTRGCRVRPYAKR